MLLPKGQDSDHLAGTPSTVEKTPETARFETVVGTSRQSGQKNEFARTMLGLAPLPAAGGSTPAEPAPASEATALVPAASAPAPAATATAFATAPAPAATAFAPTVSAKPGAEPNMTPSIEVRRKRSTMLGLAFSLPLPAPTTKAESENSEPEKQQTADGRGKHSTMLGMAPNLPEPAPTTKAENASASSSRPQSAEGSSHHSTMLGMPSVLTQHLPTSISENSVAKPEQQLSPEGNGKQHSTVRGMPPNLTQTDPANQAAKTLLGQGTFSAPPPTAVALPLTDTGKGTLIGVATPGIAPINPGVARAVAKEANEISGASEAPRSESPELGTSQKARPHSIGRALFWTLSTVAIVLALVSLAAVWRWRASPKLDVQVQSDEAGNDSLVIECKNCDEKVSFAIGNVKTNVKSHHATIPLRTPLKIGPNRVSVTMTRGTRRPEVIQLNFPVDYRVTGDMSGLDETPARLRLRIEKTPSVDFQVNNESVHFDAAGKGLFDLDVSRELVGPSSQEKLLEKRLGYQVRGANGSHSNAIVMRTTIAPLIVTVPGSIFVTEGSDLMICGQSDATSRVEIAGLQASVDKNGTFCSAAVIREFGKFDVWITAHRPGAAPRKLKLVIERTASLREYAKALYPRVAHQVPQERRPAYDDPLSLVALTGVVVDQSTLAHETRYLLKYNASGSVSTFARINSFSMKIARTGSQLTIFGEPTSVLAGPDGRTMNELNAAFELPALR